MIAGMVLSNLLYVVGAIVAATVVSGIVLLRHRRPKSLEAGIEMFSRELKALEPDRRAPGSSGTSRPIPNGANRDGGAGGGRTEVPGLRTGGSARPGGPVRPFRSAGAGRGGAGPTAPPADGSGAPASQTGRDEAGASSPHRENEPG